MNEKIKTNSRTGRFKLLFTNPCIQAWSAEKIRESNRQSEVIQLQGKANQLMKQLNNFQFKPFLQLNDEPSFMVSSLENSYSQITRLREIIQQLEDWPKASSDDDEINLSPSIKDQVSKGQVMYYFLAKKVENLCNLNLSLFFRPR